VEVDATGTGCLLIETRVFLDLQKPYFQFTPNPDKEIGGVIGEDIWFCHKAREAGYKIFVDTSVPVGHLSVLNVDGNTWRLYKKLIDARTSFKEKEEILPRMHVVK
jgi:hypothetical protein